ncbi:ABC transporter [Sulfobacillus sp. hq2]|nr:ABC transporter [Sulfobacillus sp. hq2]
MSLKSVRTMPIRPRHWRRYREIAEVLAQHGFVLVLDNLGLSAHLPWSRRLLGILRPDIDANWPERIPLVLVDLGPTYVKLGQLASTRPDLLPAPLIQALQQLQDQVPPVSFDQIQETLAHAWHQPFDHVLASLDPIPLAAASIGQVHRGVLKDGRKVVVKVRRPGIVERSEADFAILQNLADLAVRRLEWARQYDLSHVVKELISALRDELDFTVEAHNTDLAHKHFQSAEQWIPEPYWPLITPDVLVMQELEGIKISDHQAMERMGLDPGAIARRFVESLYQQVFEQGIFHGDPHPGNVHVDAQGHLIFLDWGLMGVLSPVMRARSLDLVLGLSQGRSDKVVDALQAMGLGPGAMDARSLYADVEVLRRRYYDTSLKDFRIGQALGDLMQLAQRHHIQMPVEYTLLARTAVIADGVVRQLDDNLSLIEIGKKFSSRILISRLKPAAWGPPVADAAMDWVHWGRVLPGQMEQALQTIARGEFRVMIEGRNIERIFFHWERLANRMALTFILCSVILGTAFVAHRDHASVGHAPLTEYGMILGIVVALWVVVEGVFRKRL